MVEGSAARLHDHGDEVEVGAFGCGRARPGEPVVRRVELRARRRRFRPRVRAAHELDRPCVRLGLVQRDPARDHLRRHEVVGVRRVLVEADRLRPRRLPEDVVLEDPHAAVAGELRGEASGALGEHLRGDDVVRLPGVAELARSILRVAPGYPVHLVRTDPGLVLAVEQAARSARGGARARARRRDPPRRSRKPSRRNASTCSAVNSVDQERGRVFSGS